MRPYNDIYTDIAAIPAGSALMADCARTNFAIVGQLPEGVTLIDRDQSHLSSQVDQKPDRG